MWQYSNSALNMNARHVMSSPLNPSWFCCVLLTRELWAIVLPRILSNNNLIQIVLLVLLAIAANVY